MDGLWFLKIEEEISFDKALEIDRKVWEVMSKIQSKKLRYLFNIEGTSFEDFFSAMKIKLELEGYKINIKSREEGCFELDITECPWLKIMKKSGRESLAGKVGEVICNVENQGWADAFNKDIKFTLGSQLCKGEEACRFKFKCLNSRI